MRCLKSHIRSYQEEIQRYWPYFKLVLWGWDRKMEDDQQQINGRNVLVSSRRRWSPKIWKVCLLIWTPSCSFILIRTHHVLDQIGSRITFQIHFLFQRSYLCSTLKEEWRKYENFPLCSGWLGIVAARGKSKVGESSRQARRPNKTCPKDYKDPSFPPPPFLSSIIWSINLHKRYTRHGFLDGHF